MYAVEPIVYLKPLLVLPLSENWIIKDGIKKLSDNEQKKILELLD